MLCLLHIPNAAARQRKVSQSPQHDRNRVRDAACPVASGRQPRELPDIFSYMLHLTLDQTDENAHTTAVFRGTWEKTQDGKENTRLRDWKWTRDDGTRMRCWFNQHKITVVKFDQWAASVWLTVFCSTYCISNKNLHENGMRDVSTFAGSLRYVLGCVIWARAVWWIFTPSS